VRPAAPPGQRPGHGEGDAEHAEGDEPGQAGGEQREDRPGGGHDRDGDLVGHRRTGARPAAEPGDQPQRAEEQTGRAGPDVEDEQRLAHVPTVAAPAPVAAVPAVTGRR
jgi:hypothetical protein